MRADKRRGVLGSSHHCSLEEKAPLIIEVHKRKGSMEGTRKAPL